MTRDWIHNKEANKTRMPIGFIGEKGGRILDLIKKLRGV